MPRPGCVEGVGGDGGGVVAPCSASPHPTPSRLRTTVLVPTVRPLVALQVTLVAVEKASVSAVEGRRVL